jgi:hypothetical protein
MPFVTMGSGLLLALCQACSTGTSPAQSIQTPKPDCALRAFVGDREIVETGTMNESTDHCWWLSSGGTLSIRQNVAQTIQGPLGPGSPWRERYSQSNPRDTDDGEHPQNLLRLVTKARWQNYRQEMRFRINRINPSESTERGEWSGVLLFMRYQDSGTLYYAGLRMDGRAVIKKKFAGKYTTLGQRQVFGGPHTYARQARPSLLPLEQWMDMAGVVRNQADGTVRIELYTRPQGDTGDWQIAVEAVDDGRLTPAITEAGHGGIRADFMDAEFAAYTVISQ